MPQQQASPVSTFNPSSLLTNGGGLMSEATLAALLSMRQPNASSIQGTPMVNSVNQLMNTYYALLAAQTKVNATTPAPAMPPSPMAAQLTPTQAQRVTPSATPQLPPTATPVKPATASCLLCGRVLANTTDLQQHLLGHITDRPHVCALCDAAFTTAASLNLHLLNAHR